MRNNQQQQQTVIVNQTVVMQGQNLPGQPVTPINIQTATQPSIPETTRSVNTTNVWTSDFSMILVTDVHKKEISLIKYHFIKLANF